MIVPTVVGINLNREAIVASIGLLLVVVGCSSDSGSDSQVNVYSNGYRLVSKTVDNLLFDTLDSTTVYEFDDESGQVTETGISFRDGVEERRRKIYRTDSVGRLVSEQYTQDSGDYSLEYRYFADGRISEHVGESGSFTFRYAQDLLQEVSYSRRDGFLVNVRVTFTYDAESRLVSSRNTLEGTINNYEYNDLNQIIAAREMTQGGRELFNNRYEYDRDGNLVKEVTTRQFGDVYQMTDYQYEKADAPVFNFTVMKLKLQPYLSTTVFSFLGL